MKKANVGIILIDEKTPLNIGDEIVLKKDLDNKYDKNIIKCFRNGEIIGHVSSADYTAPIDCVINEKIVPYFKIIDEIKGTLIFTGSVIYRKIDEKITNTYIVEVYLPDREEKEKEKSKIVEVIIEANKCEDNDTRLQQLVQKNMFVLGTFNSSKNEVVVNKEPVGKIIELRYKNNIITNYKYLLKNNTDVNIKSIRNNLLVGEIKLSLNIEEIIIKEYLKGIIEEIVKEEIDTKENIKDKLDYIKENNIPEFLFANILKTYIKYSKEEKKFVKKPEFTYNDKQGIMKRSLHYLTFNSKNLTLVGERGSGKSTMAETIAWIFNRRAITISFSRDTDKYDIWGYKTIDITKEGMKKVSFVDGPLTKAIKKGYITIFDEINVADPGVLESMNSVLDHRRHVYIPEIGQVKAHENFMAITTENNDNYQGVNKLNEAFKDRFIRVKCLAFESIKDLLTSRNPKLTKEMLDVLDNIYKGIRTLIKEGEISEKSLTIRGFENVAISYEPEIVSLKEVLIDCVVNQADNEDDKKHIINIINMEVL